MNNLATDMSPPFVSVAIFFFSGVIFLIISLLVLLGSFENLIGHYQLQSNIGLAHLFLVGFVMSVIFGASYQLLPVALEVPMFSKDFSYIHSILHIIATILFCSGFFINIELIRFGSLLLYVSMMIFIINALITFIKNKKYDIQSRFIFWGIIFLTIGVLIGFLLALNYFYPLLGNLSQKLLYSHIILVLFGFVFFIIIGISMTLVPMFMISHNFNQTPIENSFYIATLGISLLIIGVFTNSYFIIFGLILIFIVFFAYLYQMYIIYKVRARKKIDSWALHLIFSFWGLFGFLALFFIDTKSAFLVLFFLVFIPFINGHLTKIIPFLRWFDKFSPLVGKQKVPMLHEMINEKVAIYETYTSFIGAILLISGILLHIKSIYIIGVCFLIIGAFMVVYNIFHTMKFKV
ncbi:MAG: hypothetical protein M0P43_01835 [Arcobacteraceae bacterium]|nr:hypothetical protein [Arcobacteraceae bacterium]